MLAEARVEPVLGEDAEVLERFPGREIEGTAYEPPFPFIAGPEYGERGHTVLAGDFVTAEDGTGLVHTAIAFGEDDFRLGEQYGLNVVNPVRADGTYDERIGPYAGRFVKDADPDLIADLESRGLVYRAEQYEHAYPHCWRCDTPLLYYAKRELVHPHDGAPRASCSQPTRRSSGTRSTSSTAASASGSRTTSTGRCRASATGARRCRSGAARRATTTASARSRSCASWPATCPTTCTARTSTRSTFPCPECGQEMRRVPEVIDAWFDSGSMPFAQFHYPFENEELFKRALPRRLHLRGARPDARLVLLAARDLDAPVRPLELPERPLPRA